MLNKSAILCCGKHVRYDFGQAFEGRAKTCARCSTTRPHLLYPPKRYDRAAAAVYEKSMYKLGKGQMDVHTFLREVAEQADKDIEAVKSGRK